MLTPLPELLSYGIFSATLLRIAAAAYLCMWSYTLIARESILARAYAFVLLAVAFALMSGAWTQVAALIGIGVLTISFLYLPFQIFSRSTTILLIVILAGLSLTGAGALSFDLPL